MRSPAIIAATRFGLGPEAGRTASPQSLLDQLERPQDALIRGARNPEDIRAEYLDADRAVRVAARAMRAMRNEATTEERRAQARARQKMVRTVEMEEIGARYRHGATTPSPFLERLVLFWSNHFAIENRKLPVRLLAGAYEREVIRPHVTGRFVDMLRAATTHPAMLIYLDNDRSYGPNSRVGARRRRDGLNENLARELLELHTLGVDGGYAQADVNAMALTLTGWIGGMKTRQVNPVFDFRMHEPGARTIMGKTYGEEGEAQLLAVLDDLAAHPATARHIATKFARHFAGDGASESLIEALRVSFAESGGDLKDLAYTLLAHPDAWGEAPTKIVPPYDYVVAVGRTLGAAEVPPRIVRQACDTLGQPIWEPPSPAGWPYKDDDFLGGDSLMERIDFARTMAHRFGRQLDARQLARDVFGEDLDPFVAETVDRAEDRRQALVVLLMSPAFQRR